MDRGAFVPLHDLPDIIPPFQLTRGGAFVVLLFEHYAVKVPRKAKTNVQEICNIQNEIAVNCDNVLPCVFVNGCLVTPRVYGVACDKTESKEQAQYYKKLREEVMQKIRDLGYDPVDAQGANFIYNEKEEKIYFVDLHLVRRV